MGVYPNEGDIDAFGAEEVNLRDSTGAELLGQKTSAASLPVVLASNQPTIPVGAIDFDIRDLSHTQDSVKIGNGTYFLEINPTGSISSRTSELGIKNIFDKIFLTSLNLTTSTSELDICLIKNPSGSGKNFYLSNLSILATNPGKVITLSVYINPTIISNGTTASKYSAQIITAPPTSLMDIYTLPTISDRNSRIRVYSSEHLRDIFGPASSPLFELQPNNSVLFTASASSNNTPFVLNLRWNEI